MTRSVYIIGGAGSGKSTFMAELLKRLDLPLAALEDLHSKPNARGSLVTLRGQRLGPNGMYLGCMRPSFPGTDALDRASSLPAEEWLGLRGLPDFIVGEGATLATRRFLTALHERTELLLLHFYVEEFVADLRFLERDSHQDWKFVRNTVTRSANLARDMRSLGVKVLDVDTAVRSEWDAAMHEAHTGLVRG